MHRARFTLSIFGNALGIASTWTSEHIHKPGFFMHCKYKSIYEHIVLLVKGFGHYTTVSSVAVSHVTYCKTRVEQCSPEHERQTRDNMNSQLHVSKSTCIQKIHCTCDKWDSMRLKFKDSFIFQRERWPEDELELTGKRMGAVCHNTSGSTEGLLSEQLTSGVSQRSYCPLT